MFSLLILFRRQLTVRVPGKKPWRFYPVKLPYNTVDAYAFEIANAHPHGCPWRQFRISELVYELNLARDDMLSRPGHRRVIARAIGTGRDIEQFCKQREIRWWRERFYTAQAGGDEKAFSTVGAWTMSPPVSRNGSMASRLTRKASDAGLAVFERLARSLGYVPFISVPVSGREPVRFYVVPRDRTSYYGYALTAEKTRHECAGDTFSMGDLPTKYSKGFRAFDRKLSERERRLEHRATLERAVADGYDFDALLVRLAEVPF